MISRLLMIPWTGLLWLAIPGPEPSFAQDSPAGALAACQAAFEAEPAVPTAADCYYEAGKKGVRWDRLEGLLRSQLERFPGNASLHYALARVENIQSGSAPAPEIEERYREVIDSFHRQGHRATAVTARLSLVYYLQQVGRLEEAGTELERAAEAAGAIAGDDPHLLALVLIRRARYLLRLGRDLDYAYSLLQEAGELIFPDGPEDLRFRALDALAAVSYELGRLDECRGYRTRMLEMALETGNRHSEALARLNLAVLFKASERRGEASRQEYRRMLEEALESAVAARRLSAQAHTRRMLGKLLPGEEGLEHLETSVSIARELGDPVLLSRCLHGSAAGRVADDPAGASRLLEEAMEVALESGDPWAMLYGWPDHLTVLWATLTRAEAVSRSMAVLDDLEELRGLQGSGGGRARLQAAWLGVYNLLSGYLLDGHRPEAEVDRSPEGLEAAFRVTERRRARALLEDLTEAPVSKDLRPAKLTSLRELEAALAPDEALLSFQLGFWEDLYRRFTGGSWLWVSTREGTRVHRLPGWEQIEPDVEMVLGLTDPDLGRSAMARLHGQLLDEAFEHLGAGVDRLIIVPDGVLHLLPFGLLRPQADDRPLIARYQISMVPSATLWLRWRSSEASSGEAPVLALADPVLRRGEPASERATEHTWELDQVARLAPLPYARQEGRAVARELGGELVVGADASESFVKGTDLSRYSVLHFATHAVVFADNPERSAVLLAPGSPDEDGWLQSREITELALDGQVVVLASCDSAGGELLRSEGVASLARAFFQAGARTVVGSLRKLPDDETATLVRDFYENLRRGGSVNGALAGAQRRQIGAGAPDQAWAGLVVLGDGERVPFPGGLARSSGRLAVGMVVAVLALVVLGVFLKRRFGRFEGRTTAPD